MPIKPTTGLQAEDFIPSGQSDDEPITSFRIQPLNGEQHGDVIAQMRPEPGGNFSYTGAAITLALRYGLVAWSNFDAKYSVHNHKLIPSPVRAEIFARILEISNLDEELEKN